MDLKLDIDPLNLHEECRTHGDVSYYWGKQVAERQLDLDDLEDELKLLKAELDQDIRDDPGAFGLKKITEDAVKNAVVRHPQHQTMAKAVNQAKYDLEIAKAAIKSLDDKKKSLGLMTELWIRNYYEDPNPTPITNKMSESDKSEIRARGRARRSNDDPN